MKPTMIVLVTLVLSGAVLVLAKHNVLPQFVVVPAAVVFTIAATASVGISLTRGRFTMKWPATVDAETDSQQNGTYTQAIGTLVPAGDRWFHTDDPDLSKHLDALDNIPQGRYKVELTIGTDRKGREEWIGVELSTGQTVETDTMEDVELVVDSGLIILGCQSLLADRPDFEIRQQYEAPGPAEFDWLRSHDGQPRGLALAPPDGEGTYALRITRGQAAAKLQIIWNPEAMGPDAGPHSRTPPSPTRKRPDIF